MSWHSLPKVNQELLNFMEVSSHHAVQDALAVSSIHQQEGFHLFAKAKGRQGGNEEGKEGGGVRRKYRNT